MIIYKDNTDEIFPEMLSGFFNGWKNFPSKAKHLELLQNSDYRIIAVDEDKVVGFITAVSDKVLSAYIPLLEVLPEYKNHGIGTELLRRMLEQLRDYYIIDVVCDEDAQKFYEKRGMKKYNSMIIRNYENQDGRKTT